jgi:hypothetical protein
MDVSYRHSTHVGHSQRPVSMFHDCDGMLPPFRLMSTL